jgi:SAM-dependent methyltransferase
VTRTDAPPSGAALLYQHLIDDAAMGHLWNSGGAYEAYMGRWSRLVAADFVAWLGLPPGGRWLDIGSGTGALTTAILELATPIEVTAVEPSDGFTSWAESSIPDLRARFVTAEAERLPFDSAHFDVAVSGLALNVVSDPELAVAEMARVVRVGGLVAAYVWDYAAGMTMLRVFWDAAATVDPKARPTGEGRSSGLCHLEPLFTLFDRAGLTEVTLRAIDVQATFDDFEDFWGPFLAGQGEAPHYAMSLDPERREALRTRLEQSLAVGPDGTISMPLRAWAIRAPR